ncbi:MAG TPA: recombinase family protein [Vicinamibacterales bacterium]|nr:recombinase family protein [Vicinamibacterales bacterium]
MATPAAYLRKSKDAATKQEHLDRLLRTIREHSPAPEPVVYDDWARSGDRAKLASRRQWAELCEAIERGEHDAVYMNDLDRGGRSLEEWLRFIRVAQEHGCAVIAAGVDYSRPENKDRLVFEGWLAERELDAAKRRANATIAMRTKRGDKIGGAPYGKRFGCATCGEPKGRCGHADRVVLVDDPDRPVQPVLDALAECRNNIAMTVRLLNERAVPSRFGRQWSDAALRSFLRRNRSWPPASRRARRTRSGTRMPSPLSRLVRCSCGNWMTPVDAQSKLYCYLGNRDGMARHGKHTVSQRRVWDAIAAEAERMGRETRRTVTHTFGGTDAAQRRVELEEELRRLGRAYQAGAYDDREFDAERDRLTAAIETAREEEAEADEAATLRVRMTGPVVDLRLRESDPVRLGEQLRRAFREIRLDRDLRPVEFVSRS